MTLQPQIISFYTYILLNWWLLTLVKYEYMCMLACKGSIVNTPAACGLSASLVHSAVSPWWVKTPHPETQESFNISVATVFLHYVYVSRYPFIDHPARKSEQLDGFHTPKARCQTQTHKLVTRSSLSGPLIYTHFYRESDKQAFILLFSLEASRYFNHENNNINALALTKLYNWWNLPHLLCSLHK